MVTTKGHEIEPSGAIWVPNLKIAIGVSDERNDAPGYEIFWFDPNKIDTSSKTILVTPLLTQTQSDQFQLDDLEGITEINGEFFVIGSLSLDKNAVPVQDRWSRHQAYRFRIAKDIFENTSGFCPNLMENLKLTESISWQLLNISNEEKNASELSISEVSSSVTRVRKLELIKGEVVDYTKTKFGILESRLKQMQAKGVDE